MINLSNVVAVFICASTSSPSYVVVSLGFLLAKSSFDFEHQVLRRFISSLSTERHPLARDIVFDNASVISDITDDWDNHAQKVASLNYFRSVLGRGGLQSDDAAGTELAVGSPLSAADRHGEPIEDLFLPM